MSMTHSRTAVGRACGRARPTPCASHRHTRHALHHRHHPLSVPIGPPQRRLSVLRRHVIDILLVRHPRRSDPRGERPLSLTRRGPRWDSVRQQIAQRDRKRQRIVRDPRARGDGPISSLPRLSPAGDEIGQSIVGPGEHLWAQAIGLYLTTPTAKARGILASVRLRRYFCHCSH